MRPEHDLVLAGGRVLDPARNVDAVLDVGLRDGCIAALGLGLEGRRREDCSGRLVLPGFIDLHVHFREPGGEAAETVASGLAAAVAGGFTTVVVMPNTRPPLDSPELVQEQLALAARAGLARLEVAAAATRGRAGQEPADLEALAAAGAIAFTDDGDAIANRAVMGEVLRRAAVLVRPVLQHAVDSTQVGRGVMREGPTAAALGVPGIPESADDDMVLRDLELLAETGGHLHLQHLATAGSVALLREGRSRGLQVTGEVTPHHLALCDEDVARQGTAAKMAPPLASRAGRLALIEGVRDGTVGSIATDHAPHTDEAKGRGLEEAPCGVLGLETALPVVLETLVHGAGVSLATVVAALTSNPARVLGLEAGTLAPGSRADVTVVDPEARVTCRVADMRSRSRNSPFDGFQGRGRVCQVYVGGQRVY